MADSGSKPKCKYWDKCYQKGKAHKDNFLHPGDLTDASTKKGSPKKSNIDLNGKKIVFTGALSNATRKQASARAKMFGCIVVSAVSKFVDIVIVGSDSGQKADQAEALGIKMLSEDDWDEMLEAAKPVRGYKASRNKNAAEASDSDDEDYEPSKKKKVPNIKKKALQSKHDISESDNDTDDNALPPASKKKQPAVRKKTHSVSDEEESEDLTDVEDSTKKGSTKKTTVDLSGKKIVFTGTLTQGTRNKASERAMKYGCCISNTVSRYVDYVIVGDGAGGKADKASDLGITTLSEDEWEEMLKSAKQVKGNKADESDDEDDALAPSSKKKTTATSKRTHDASDEESEELTDVEDSTKKGSTKKTTVDLSGKKIVFTGTLTQGTRNKASEKARKYGCCISNTVSRYVDYVIVGDGAGGKADKASDLGITTLSEDEWEEMLKSAKQVQGNKADESDDEDDAIAPSSKKKTTATSKRTHDMSDEESDDVSTSPAPKKKMVTKGTNTDAKPGPSGDSGTGATASKPKCKYWAKCYRKDATHLKSYRHPAGHSPGKSPTKSNAVSDEEDMDTGNGEDIKPKTAMDDGDVVDIQSGATTYRIKRTGDHYYCTCMAWKNQNKPVDSRTCKHLREHLGDEFEKARCGGSLPAGPVRAPKQKSIPQLLLAHKYTESTNPKGWWLSEKLDGVRAYWDGQGFYSRLGNEFVPPAWFTKGYPSDMELDGELFGGRGKFQSTVSIVKSGGSEKWKQLTYQVFDAPGIGNKPFEKRLQVIQEHFDEHSAPTIVILDQEKCQGKQHLTEELERVESLGGEGLMIRQPGSKYANGRSHTLLKIKTFHDAEARVIGYEGGKGKNTGLVGALRCEMANGKKFNVGSGLKDADRHKPPKKGSIITYRFQELTNDGIPRFPSYVGVRADMDEPKDPDLPPKPTDG